MYHDKAVKYWDCRETAKNYVTASSLLAGFSFASIFLLLDGPASTGVTNDLLNQTSTAFLIGFFGCIISMFNYSIISGEGELTPRVYNLMLIAGSNFTLSGLFLFWGLIPFFRLHGNILSANLSIWIFCIAILFIVMFLIFSALDNIILLNGENMNYQTVKASSKISLLTIPTLPIIISIIIKQFIPVITDSILANYPTFLFGLLIFLSIGGIITGIVTHLGNDFKLSHSKSIIWLTTHTTAFGILIILIPN